MADSLATLAQLLAMERQRASGSLNDPRIRASTVYEDRVAGLPEFLQNILHWGNTIPGLGGLLGPKKYGADWRPHVDPARQESFDLGRELSARWPQYIQSLQPEITPGLESSTWLDAIKKRISKGKTAAEWTTPMLIPPRIPHIPMVPDYVINDRIQGVLEQNALPKDM